MTTHWCSACCSKCFSAGCVHLPGTQELRALLVFDEVYGVGVILATQNPMDIEYRALSNASLWYVGRLQTDADRERVVEAMSQSGGTGSQSAARLAQLVNQLANRYFSMRNLRAKAANLTVLQPRWAMSYLRGPLTPAELRLLRQRLNGEELNGKAAAMRV